MTIIPSVAIAIIRIALIDASGMVCLSRWENIHIARYVDKQKERGRDDGRAVIVLTKFTSVRRRR